MGIRNILAAIAGCAVSIVIISVFGGSNHGSQRTCVDGWRSPSIGIQGACSHHGGVKKKEQDGSLLWLGAIFAGMFTFGVLSKNDESKPSNSQANQTDSNNLNSRMRNPSGGNNSSRTDALICPKCGAEMKLRTARKGRYVGSQFWGCSKFPKCKVIVPVRH